jgi:hypothetical protein
MSIKVRVAGAIQTATAIRVMVNGSLRPAKKVSVMAGGALRAFFMLGQSGGGSSFVLNRNIDQVDGEKYSAKPTRVTTGPVTVTPTGGVSPYSYLWERISGDSRVTPTNPTTATTTFGATLFDDTVEAVFRCTATDAAGASATTTVEARLTHYSSL